MGLALWDHFWVERVVGLSRGVVESPPLEVLKKYLDITLESMV